MKIDKNMKLFLSFPDRNFILTKTGHYFTKLTRQLSKSLCRHFLSSLSAISFVNTDLDWSRKHDKKSCFRNRIQLRGNNGNC